MNEKQEIDVPATPSGPNPDGKRGISKIAHAIAVCVLVFVLLGAGYVLGILQASGNTSPASNNAATEQNASAAKQELPDAQDEQHAHDWVAQYGTVHHDAETHNVHHDAKYEDQTVYHVVCNTCGKIIDDKAVDHIEKTGHAGYTKDVPRAEKVLVSEAYVETVVDKEAYDETVLSGYLCADCGKTVSADEATAAGIHSGKADKK